MQDGIVYIIILFDHLFTIHSVNIVLKRKTKNHLFFAFYMFLSFLVYNYEAVTKYIVSQK